MWDTVAIIFFFFVLCIWQTDRQKFLITSFQVFLGLPLGFFPSNFHHRALFDPVTKGLILYMNKPLQPISKLQLLKQNNHNFMLGFSCIQFQRKDLQFHADIGYVFNWYAFWNNAIPPYNQQHDWQNFKGSGFKPDFKNDKFSKVQDGLQDWWTFLGFRVKAGFQFHQIFKGSGFQFGFKTDKFSRVLRLMNFQGFRVQGWAQKLHQSCNWPQEETIALKCIPTECISDMYTKYSHVKLLLFSFNNCSFEL